MTPGPWKLRGCELIGCGTLIATVHWHSGRQRENVADGLAIQALPDLIAACEIAFDDIDKKTFPATHAVLRGALTKAGVM